MSSVTLFVSLLIGLRMLDDKDYQPVEIEIEDDDFTKAIKNIILKTVVLEARNRLSAADVMRELDSITLCNQVKDLGYFQCQSAHGSVHNNYRPRSEGDNVLGIFRPSICVSICPSSVISGSWADNLADAVDRLLAMTAVNKHILGM